MLAVPQPAAPAGRAVSAVTSNPPTRLSAATKAVTTRRRDCLRKVRPMTVLPPTAKLLALRLISNRNLIILTRPVKVEQKENSVNAAHGRRPGSTPRDLPISARAHGSRCAPGYRRTYPGAHRPPGRPARFRTRWHPGYRRTYPGAHRLPVGRRTRAVPGPLAAPSQARTRPGAHPARRGLSQARAQPGALSQARAQPGARSAG